MSNDVSGGPGSRFLRQRTRSRGPTIAIVVVLLLIAAGISWWAWSQREEPEPPVATQEPMDVPPLTTPSATPPPIDLPELSASDARVRDLLAALSANPGLAGWLANDDLVRRFVATVANVSAGVSPVQQLDFLRPEQAFGVQEVEGRLYIDPASFRRYNTIVAVFTSLDTRGTAQLYHQLHPLFEDAYAELGLGEETFDDAMARAMGRVLAVPVPDAPPEVVPSAELATGYAYADTRFESAGVIEKHLLRMGPNNARRVQAKVRELAAAIGIQPRT